MDEQEAQSEAITTNKELKSVGGMYASHICIMVVNYHKDMQMCKLSALVLFVFVF